MAEEVEVELGICDELIFIIINIKMRILSLFISLVFPLCY